MCLLQKLLLFCRGARKKRHRLTRVRNIRPFMRDMTQFADTQHP